jgi:lipopolysaccharide assembly outer membrane protein LptD (OstA)
VGILGCAAGAGEPTASPQKAAATPKSSPSMANIPLPIGQEAKGLILPDFDLEGHMRARFEAITAKRIDNDHLQFKGLRMTTFTPENATDLLIDMPESTLDLNTRVITSNQRTTVARSDFQIYGDRMSFDTIGRKGTMSGNVKMVITSQTEPRKKPGE